MKTGFIGLGAMGRPMALNLLRADIPLVVHDIDRARVGELTAAGAGVAASARDVAAAANRTICMVETTEQAEDVITGPDGIMQGAGAGHLVLCMSTIDPAAALAMAARLAERRITMLDAPVSGGTGRAEAGDLTVIVGGSERDFEDCRDIFDAIGRTAFHVGPSGQGLVMKLVNNMLGITNTITLIEGLAIGAKSGLDLETMYRVIRESSGHSAAAELRVPRIINDDFAPGGTVDIVYKDQELITAHAKRIGVPVFMANVSQQVYQMARAAGLNKLDSSVVVRIYERLAGVEIVGKSG